MAAEITRERLNYAMGRKVKWRILSKKFDRFKRMYIVHLDRNNMEPTGQVERAFTAPIDVPDTFLKFPEDRPWRVDLMLEDYARYLKQQLAAWELRFQEIRDARPKGESDERVWKLVGPGPQDWRLVVLLSRGDPWCLGKTTKRTPAVEKLIGPAPTRKQLALEARTPRDLRLDPELEALIGEGVRSEFPDEADELDEELKLRDLTVSRQEAEDLDIDISEDDLEDELTGDVDLDDEPVLDTEPRWDTAQDLEEEVDRNAQGGKKENPRKNRTRPAKE